MEARTIEKVLVYHVNFHVMISIIYGTDVLHSDSCSKATIPHKISGFNL